MLPITDSVVYVQTKMMADGWDTSALLEAARDAAEFKKEMVKLGLLPGQVFKLRGVVREYMKEW